MIPRKIFFWLWVFPPLLMIPVAVALVLTGGHLPKRGELVLGMGSWEQGCQSALILGGYYVEAAWLAFLYPGTWAVHAVAGWPMDDWRALMPGAVLSWLVLIKLNLGHFLRRLIWWRDPFSSLGNKVGLFLPFVRLAEWWEMARKFGQEPTAKWASIFEVLSEDYGWGDVFLGRPYTILGGLPMAVGVETEKHMVTIAGTGSGKSTAGLIPNLCSYPGSVLVIDPKGELARITAMRRSDGGNGVDGMGQSLAVFDPFGVTDFDESPSYNPFAEMEALAQLNEDSAVSFAGKIADALVRPTGATESYWDNAACTLIRGLVLYIFVQEERANRNLVRLRHLLMNGDSEGFEAMAKKGPMKRGGVSAFDLLLDKMEQARFGRYGEIIAGAASSMRNMGDNQLGGVLTSAQEHTKFLDIPEIQKVLKKSHLLLSGLKKRPWSVYVCLPMNAVTGPENRWLRLFVMLFIDVMMRTKEKPLLPVLLAIDEFPNLGRLDGIELVAPVMRSYGVRMWVFGQDIAQFKMVYPDTWTGLIGGAEAVQFMGLNHPATLDFLMDLIGEHEVTRRTGQGMRTEARALLDREQLARFLDKKKGNQIVWFGRRRPMRLKIAPYYEYLPPWYYSPDRNYREGYWRRLYRKLSPPEPVFAGLPPDDDYDPPSPPSPPVDPWEISDEGAEKKHNKGGLVKAPRKELEPEKPAPLRTTSALDELRAIKFQERVQEEIESLVNLVALQKKREREGMPPIVFSHHMVFTGSPGTGKTTVARIVGRIFKEIGLLKSGHVIEAERADMIAEYVGQTAPKVRKLIDRALDGLLFIDEAYALAPEDSRDDFGAEAIATLLKAMEDERERLIVIVAGYEKEMEHFIRSNPGLESRFKTVIHFYDYDPFSLAALYNDMCENAGCRVSMDAMNKVCDVLCDRQNRYRADNGAGWGNGRLARNLFEKSIMQQAARAARQKNADIRIIEASDVPDKI